VLRAGRRRGDRSAHTYEAGQRPLEVRAAAAILAFAQREIPCAPALPANSATTCSGESSREAPGPLPLTRPAAGNAARRDGVRGPVSRRGPTHKIRSCSGVLLRAMGRLPPPGPNRSCNPRFRLRAGFLKPQVHLSANHQPVERQQKIEFRAPPARGICPDAAPAVPRGRLPGQPQRLRGPEPRRPAPYVLPPPAVHVPGFRNSPALKAVRPIVKGSLIHVFGSAGERDV